MKYKFNKSAPKLNSFYLFLVSLMSLLYIMLPFDIYAQDPLSISVTPPIYEVMIQPGKEITQVFSVTNLGGKTTLKPKIVYFEPSDLLGNVKITDKLAPDWIKFDPLPISLDQGQSHEFIVLISPSVDVPETDHNITILFETATAQDLLKDNSAFYNAQIGANILLSISIDGKPKKNAETVSFNAPFIVDWLMPVNYEVTLANSGNSFWKPIGKININEDEILNLAPLNILSGYSRYIPCINGENLIDCTSSKKILIGIKKANLEFILDDDPQIYGKEVTTVVFPFSLLFGIIIIVTVSKLVNYLLTKNGIKIKFK